MDYTTLARVKSEAGIQEATDDTLLASLITSASRWLDRELTGVGVGSDNYLLAETITNEYTFGQVDADGNIQAWLHKPIVTSVTAFAWRTDPSSSWMSVDVSTNLQIDGYRVIAYNAALANRVRGKVLVRATYVGGLATAVASLPGDLLEDATVMTVRIYRENKTGLTDSMGVAELGTATYTKAVPVRLSQWIQSYKRVVPW